MIDRRQLLQGIGVATAASILWACGPAVDTTPRTVAGRDEEVRGWLREAVARLASLYPTVHALASSSRRVAAAVDILGAGVTRGRVDGVVFVVRDRDGRWREEVGSDLSAQGIASLVTRLGATKATPRAKVEFGRAVQAERLHGKDPEFVDDAALRQRAENMAGKAMSSRIVYAAGLVEIDDATVWSVAPGADLQQRLVRVRRSATRVAWNGTRPVVSETSRGWRGGVDDAAIDAQELARAERGALELMTPSAFPDGDHAILLHPEVAAAVVGTIARTLLVASAMRRPEVAGRLAIGSQATAPAITLVDDPTAPGAYGGYAFDDEGVVAKPIVLLQNGVVAARLGDRSSGPAIPGGRGVRAGHVGRSIAGPSHLSILAGAVASKSLLDDGFWIENPRSVVVDPSSGRITVVVGRAREIVKGSATGRVFADIEVTGDLGILAAMTSVSSDRQAFAYRDDLAGLPAWRSVEVPWILSHATVRGRRRA